MEETALASSRICDKAGAKDIRPRLKIHLRDDTCD